MHDVLSFHKVFYSSEELLNLTFRNPDFQKPSIYVLTVAVLSASLDGREMISLSSSTAATYNNHAIKFKETKIIKESLL